MYIILVSPAGTARKGTAMAPVGSFLKKARIPTCGEKITPEALIKLLADTKTVTPTTDPQCLPVLHSSLTVFSPELITFLGYNNLAFMALLTDFYDCPDNWKNTTKNKGVNEIDGLFLNLLGATTPEIIQSALPMDAIGGGFTSRIIFVYEEKRGKVIPFPEKTEEERELEKTLTEDLKVISKLSGEFALSPEAKVAYGEWYTKEAAQEGQFPESFRGYESRRSTHLFKLSMCLSAAKSDDLIIEADDIRDAIQIIERTEVKMFKTLNAVGSNDILIAMKRIMEYLENNPYVTNMDIIRMNIRNFSEQDISTKVIPTLTSARLIQEMGFEEKQERGIRGKGQAWKLHDQAIADLQNKRLNTLLS